MNYCTKCESWYTKPGTCNCYAPAPALMTPVPTWVPMPCYPPPTVAPYWPTYPAYPWRITTTPTITWGTGYTSPVIGNLAATAGVVQ